MAKKYVTFIIQTKNDGSIASAVRAYDTLKEAEHAYYGELASGSGADKLKADFVAIFDNNGTSYTMGHVGEYINDDDISSTESDA